MPSLSSYSLAFPPVGMLSVPFQIQISLPPLRLYLPLSATLVSVCALGFFLVYRQCIGSVRLGWAVKNDFMVHTFVFATSASYSGDD